MVRARPRIISVSRDAQRSRVAVALRCASRLTVEVIIGRALKEMVRVNHMRNCLLCHAPSGGPNDGLVRGSVPTPGHPLPPAYYQATTGDFVRADITFLRQDFSVILPVKAASPWPDEQRFDFITRVRPAKDKELKELSATPAKSGNYQQREAVLYALRKLTGQDGGDSTEKWRGLMSAVEDKKSSPTKDK